MMICMAAMLFLSCSLLAASAGVKVRTVLDHFGELQQLDSSRTLENDNCRIFALWNYTDFVPSYVNKNIESWRLNSRNRCPVVLVNESNVKDLIPDLPDEFHRLPDHAAQSDFVRYALLYHHGGMYMDTDFLVAKDLSPILDKMDEYDFVSYTNDMQHCDKGSFSSNFLAGRKHSSFHKTVWEQQKQAVARRCPGGKLQEMTELCCRDDGCKVPWASLGEDISHKVFRSLLSTSTVKYYCFEESRGEGFAPGGIGIVLSGHRKLDDAVKFFADYKTRNPLDRIMYHLFNAQGFAERYGGESLYDDSLFIGHLYRLSGVSRDTNLQLSGPTSFCAEGGAMCSCTGTVIYGIMNPDAGHGITGEPRSLQLLLQSDYLYRKVDGTIRCDAAEFGGDPAHGHQKMCMCQQR